MARSKYLPYIVNLFSGIPPQSLSHHQSKLVGPVFPQRPRPMIRGERLQAIQLKQMPIYRHKADEMVGFPWKFYKI